MSLGCFYYFHTILCSQMTSGGDLCQTALWNKSMNCFLCCYWGHVMNRHLCGSRKYNAVLCLSIRGDDARWCPISQLGCGGFPGMVSGVLHHHRIGVYFHFGRIKINWCQENYLYIYIYLYVYICIYTVLKHISFIVHIHTY